MPNCISITKKGDNQPMKFPDVDAFICEKLGVLPDPVQWYAGWYDIIGFSIACGNNIGSDKLWRIVAGNDKLCDVLRVLEEHFVSDAWYEGRR